MRGVEECARLPLQPAKSLDASSTRNETMRVGTGTVRMGGVIKAVAAEEGDDAAEAEAREGGTIAAEAPRRHHCRVGFGGGRHDECQLEIWGGAERRGKEGKKRQKRERSRRGGLRFGGVAGLTGYSQLGLEPRTLCV